MAHTGVQLEVEDWVRTNWMSERFKAKFYRNRLRLRSGGFFDFDAVSEDESIAACISTSSGITASNKFAVGKMHKMRSDMLFLLLAEKPRKRLLILTELNMHAALEKEIANGRLPAEIDLELAIIPIDLQERLVKARAAASREVTPQKIAALPDEVLLAEKSD